MTYETIEIEINALRRGRTQSYIIKQMELKGCIISDSQFSRKKKGFCDFTKRELKILRSVLKSKQYEN